MTHSWSSHSLSDNQIDEVGCGAMVAMLTRNRFVENLEYVAGRVVVVCSSPTIATAS